VWLVVFFIVATALNITKAFHIDDAYHVKAAQWIVAHPLQPMSGTINWTGWVQHFYDGNQPPLFFYGMALWGLMFGFGEIAMHSFEALFTALCIVLFHRLAGRVVAQHALWLTGLLVLSPAFLVNQNVMVDVPLLACILGLLDRLIAALHQSSTRKLFQAALVLTVGIFIKYTMLALFPLLPFVAWRLRGRAWLAVLVPLVAMASWSAWNQHEFAFAHILGRSVSGFSTDGLGNRMITWIMTLGAIAPWLFAGFLAPWSRWAHRSVWFVLSTCTAFIGFAWYGTVGPEVTDRVLLTVFLINGTLGLGALIATNNHGDPCSRVVHQMLIAGIGLLAVFIILFAPWMATRHVLLVLPMFLLLAANEISNLSRTARRALLICTALLGIALGISDRQVAAFYRDSASRIAQEYQGRTIWFSGSLGWGFYAEKEGMVDFSSQPAPVFNAGDMIAQPLDFMVPGIPEQVRTIPIDTVIQVLDRRDRFSTRHWLRFYSASYPVAPWTINRAQPERILVSRIMPY
jgi:4-amino-4-deoxy-L-arabinose transferase-like glycosyltransferase